MSIVERVEKYDFSKVEFLRAPFLNQKDGFVVKIKLKEFPNSSKRVLVAKGETFNVYAVRLNAKSDSESYTRLEKADNIGIYADEDGFSYLLEIKMNFASPYGGEDREIILDLVLNLFDARKDYAYAYFDGVKLLWVYGGEVANCDYVFGNPLSADNTADMDDSIVDEFSVGLVDNVIRLVERVTSERDMNYYSPRGYNAWAGDVVNYYHDGVYHLAYLYDRHHHGSRWGGGAHTMRHFTTTDFVNWFEAPPIVELDEQWKTIGTGTLFFHDGKFYLSHGWHTSRMLPDEKTASSIMRSDETEGRIAPVSYAELRLKGLTPSGANYAVSDDGINFVPGDKVIHVSENPSVYVDNSGRLTMYSGYGSSGIWHAESVGGEWILDKGAQLPASKLLPSDECPSLFESNGYKYLIMGGTGYWRTEKNSDEYEDFASKGYDVYDGLSYPMATVVGDGRILAAGWINGGGWGSVIVHRELVQSEDGRLNMRWVRELSPKKETMTPICVDGKRIKIDPEKSYYFEWTTFANAESSVTVRLVGKSDVELRVDSKREVVQINSAEKGRTSDDVSPICEMVEKFGGVGENIHKNCKNFALGKVDFVDKQYATKMRIYYEKKIDGVIIDCEIGGNRTIVSNRVGQTFFEVKFDCENATFGEIFAYEG